LSLNHPLFVIDYAEPEVSAKANPYFISQGGVPIKGRNGVPNLTNIYAIIEERQQYHNIDDYFNSKQLQLNISL